MLINLLLGGIAAPVFYVLALRSAMGAKRWGLFGLVAGPLAWPMFVTHRRLHLLKSRTPHAVTWVA